MKIRYLFASIIFFIPFITNAQTVGSYWKLLNNNLLPVTTNYTMEVSSTTGTSTIDGNLRVKKNLQVDGNFFAPVALQLTGFTQGSVLFVGSGSTIAQNNANFFFDNTNGRVGIGTTGPGSKLTVAADVSQLHLQGATDAAGYYTDIGSLYDSSHPFQLSVQGTERMGVYADFGSNPRVVFPNGNVGIGTTNPSSLLHVKAADTVTGVITVGGGKETVTAVGEVNSRLDFGSNDGSVTGGVGGRIGSVTEINNGARTGLAFSTYSQGADELAERMRIDYQGNIGIGTTNPAYKLDIPGNYLNNFRVGFALIGGHSGSDYDYIGYNFKPTSSTGSYTYDTTDTASAIKFGSGGFQFLTAPSGSAGAGITPTQAFTVLQNGNVGIGTTTPSQKLDVNGNINLEGSSNGIIMHDTATASCYLVQITNGALALTAHACQ